MKYNFFGNEWGKEYYEVEYTDSTDVGDMQTFTDDSTVDEGFYGAKVYEWYGMVVYGMVVKDDEDDTGENDEDDNDKENGNKEINFEY